MRTSTARWPRLSWVRCARLANVNAHLIAQLSKSASERSNLLRDHRRILYSIHANTATPLACPGQSLNT
jgi:hypothetical protein